MDKITEKLQEEAWAKLSPYFEWHRLLIFLGLNFLLSPGFLDVVLFSFETKTLRDITEIFGDIASELRIKDLFFSILVSFWVFPWVSNKFIWTLLKKFHFQFAKPLRKWLQTFAEKTARNEHSAEYLATKIGQEKIALRKFKSLQLLNELWLVAIAVSYIKFGQSLDISLFWTVCLAFVGFCGLSQLMMLVFLKEIVPAQIIRQVTRFNI